MNRPLLDDTNTSIQPKLFTSERQWKTRFLSILIVGILIIAALIPFASFGIYYLSNDSDKIEYSTGYQKYILSFDQDGKFKILQLTDLHYGDKGWEADFNTTRVISNTIDYEKPQLIIITGDAISGYVWEDPKARKGCLAINETNDPVKECWKSIFNVLNAKKIPWAFVFGNHDREANYNTNDFLKLFSTSPYYIMDFNKPYFHIKITSSKDNRRAATVWGFDTNDFDCYNVSGWSCIDLNQIRWYDEEYSKMISLDGRRSFATAYFHIPLIENMVIYNSFVINGTKRETVGCSVINTGAMASFLRNGDIQTIWTGHDHVNDYFGGYFAGVFHKKPFPIALGYGRKTGYGCYGTLPRGGRILELTESDVGINWNSWIIIENGTREYQLEQHQPGHESDPEFQDTCEGPWPRFAKYEDRVI